MSCVLNTVINEGIKNFSYKDEFVIYKNSIFIPESDTRTLDKTFGIAKGIQKNIEKAYPSAKWGHFTGVNKRADGHEVIIDIPYKLENAYAVIDGKKTIAEVNQPIRDLFTAYNSSIDKIEETINHIISEGSKLKLSADEKYYVHKETGKKYERVTSTIKDAEFDANSPYAEKSSLFGNEYDRFVRDFFDGSLNKSSFNYFSESDINRLEQRLIEIKFELESRGETIVSKDITLHNDELGIAGTVDLLSYDEDGNISIYDIKSMRGDNFTNNGYGNKYDSEAVFEADIDPTTGKQKMVEDKEFGLGLKPAYKIVRGQIQDSKREQHTKQLSLYKILAEKTYGVNVVKLGVLPIEQAYVPSSEKTILLQVRDIIDIIPISELKDIFSLKYKNNSELFRDIETGANTGADLDSLFNDYDFEDGAFPTEEDYENYESADNSEIIMSRNADSIYGYTALTRDTIKKLQHQVDMLLRKPKNTHTYNQISNIKNEILRLRNNIKKYKVDSQNIESILTYLQNDFEGLNAAFEPGNIDLNGSYLENRGQYIKMLDYLSKMITGYDLDGNSFKDLQIDFKGFSTSDFNVVEEFNYLKDKMKLADITALEKRIGNRAWLRNFLEGYNKNKPEGEQITTEQALKFFSEAKEKSDIDIFVANFLGSRNTDDTVFTQMIALDIEEAENENLSLVNDIKDKLDDFISKLSNPKDVFKILKKNGLGQYTLEVKDIFSPIYYKAVTQFHKGFENITDFGKKYAAKVNYIDKNFNVIDYRKLSYFKNLYSGTDFQKHFVFSDAEMAAYENGLKTQYGDTYSYYLDNAKKKLENYERYYNDRKTQLLTANKIEAAKIHNAMKVHDVFEFLNIYNSNNKFQPTHTVGKKNYYSDMSFLTLGHTKAEDINTDFQDILNDTNLFNYWSEYANVLQNLVNPTYGSVNDNYVSKLELVVFHESLLNKFTEVWSNKGKGLGDLIKSIGNNIQSMAMYTNTSNRGEDSDSVVSNYQNNIRSQIYNQTTANYGLSDSELNKLASENNINTSGLTKKEIANAVAKEQIYKGYSFDPHVNMKAILDMLGIQMARQEVSKYSDIFMDMNRQIKTTDKDGNVVDRKRSNERMSNTVDKVVFNKSNNAKDSKYALIRWLVSDKKNYYTNSRNHSPLFRKLGSLLQLIAVNHSNQEALLVKTLMSVAERKLSDVDKYEFKTVNGNYVIVENGQAYMLSEKDFEKFHQDIKTEVEKKSGKIINIKDYGPKMGSEKYQEKLQEYVNQTINSLGTGLSPISPFEYLLKKRVFKYMVAGVNGIKNAIEGTNTGMIIAMSGTHGIDVPSYLKADRELAFANILRLGDKFELSRLYPNKIAKIKTIMKMLDRAGVLQDKRDELQRNKDNNTLGSFDSIFFDWAIDKPEFKNQGALILAWMMNNITVNKVGTEDVFDENFHPDIYVPGTTTLKDEYRTEENINTFEKFNSDVFNKAKANSKRLVNTQTNFDKNDYTEMSQSLWGQYGFNFKKWMPERYHLNWAGLHNAVAGKENGLDLTTGENFKDGNYTQLIRTSKTAASVAITANLARNFGLMGFGGAMALTGGIALPFGLVAIYGGFSAYSTGTALSKIKLMDYLGKTTGTTPETLAESIFSATIMLKKLLLSTISAPMFHLKAGNDKYNPQTLLNIGDNKFAKLLGVRDGVMTVEKMNAMNAVASELGISLLFLSLYFLAGTAYEDDEDDTLEEAADKKLKRNYIDNQLASFIEFADFMQNPMNLVEETSRIGVIQDLTKMTQTTKRLFGGDRSVKGFNSLSITEQIVGTHLPIPDLITKMIFDKSFKSEADITTKEGYYGLRENFLSDGEYQAKKDTKLIRHLLREELKDTEEYSSMEEKAAKKALNKEVNNILGEKKDFGGDVKLYDEHIQELIKEKGIEDLVNEGDKIE